MNERLLGFYYSLRQTRFKGFPARPLHRQAPSKPAWVGHPHSARLGAPVELLKAPHGTTIAPHHQDHTLLLKQERT
jgi:hypothetical protein